jgi:predicted small lipoprotein YifL
MPVSVRVMGEPGVLRGHIQSIAAGIEDRDRVAGANLLPNVNPTFSWVRLAQRVPVRVALDQTPADLRMIAGRTATVAVLGRQAARNRTRPDDGSRPMSALRVLAAAASLLALAACTTVGPNYKVPEAAKVKAPTAQGAFIESATPAVSQAPVPDGWWKLYDDPVLNGLVQEALTANTDLRIAAANLARAHAVAAEADDAGGFSTTASAAAMHSRESGEQFLKAEQLPVENLADVGVKVSYQVDLVGRIKRAAEAAHADAEAGQAALDLTRISVAADVARAYVEACASGHELAVAQHTVDLQTRSCTSPTSWSRPVAGPAWTSPAPRPSWTCRAPPCRPSRAAVARRCIGWRP